MNLCRLLCEAFNFELFYIPGELLTLANVIKMSFKSLFHVTTAIYINYDHVDCNTAQIETAASVFRVGVFHETLVPT
jgi:hypothetical protein